MSYSLPTVREGEYLGGPMSLELWWLLVGCAEQSCRDHTSASCFSHVLFRACRHNPALNPLCPGAGMDSTATATSWWRTGCEPARRHRSGSPLVRQACNLGSWGLQGRFGHLPGTCRPGLVCNASVQAQEHLGWRNTWTAGVSWGYSLDIPGIVTRHISSAVFSGIKLHFLLWGGCVC